jgi:hypothetical protein
MPERSGPRRIAGELHALRHHWRGFETDDGDVTRSWSEIGLMLGVSEQPAQRKYAAKISA